MKTVFVGVMVGVLLMISPCTFADDHKAEPAQAQLQETIDRLELTDEQIEKARPVLENAVDKRDAILKKYGLDEASLDSGAKRPGRRSLRAMRGEMDELSDETIEDLRAILTAEQIDEYEALQTERREEMRNRIRGAG